MTPFGRSAEERRRESGQTCKWGERSGEEARRFARNDALRACRENLKVHPSGQARRGSAKPIGHYRQANNTR
jgi:hypothetical protein